MSCTAHVSHPQSASWWYRSKYRAPPHWTSHRRIVSRRTTSLQQSRRLVKTRQGQEQQFSRPKPPIRWVCCKHWVRMSINIPGDVGQIAPRWRHCSPTHRHSGLGVVDCVCVCVQCCFHANNTHRCVNMIIEKAIYSFSWAKWISRYSLVEDTHWCKVRDIGCTALPLFQGRYMHDDCVVGRMERRTKAGREREREYGFWEGRHTDVSAVRVRERVPLLWVVESIPTSIPWNRPPNVICVLQMVWILTSWERDETDRI